jgi:hypothetical protein
MGRLQARLYPCSWAPALAIVGLLGLAEFGMVGPAGGPPAALAQSNDRVVTSIPFGETNGAEVYNASGAVPLADSRFLFCDNKSGDALFELDLSPEGRMKNRLIRRPLQGVAPGAVKDLESMTIAEEGGRRFIFASSSLSVKISKYGEPHPVVSTGLLRVTVNPNDSLSAENIPDFREWLIRNVPEIGASAKLVPDESGLNIEGLAWDESRHALLFGLRTPLSSGKPMVIPVKIKNLSGPWTTANLEALPPIQLLLEGADGSLGIRSMEYIPIQHSFLVVLGKTISKMKAPFAVYEWNGYPLGKLRRLDLAFAEKMKPEGLTSGTVAGKPMLLFLDDAGGYQVLWLDKTRLF